MQTWAVLDGGRNWALRLDGFITRTCMVFKSGPYHARSLETATTSGHMFAITNADDFEFYSANSKGGIQGNGYQCRNAGYADAFPNTN